MIVGAGSILGVYETEADLTALQDLLDRSYAAAGPHLRNVITPERRVGAAEPADRLTGMRLLALATVTADGRPIVRGTEPSGSSS